MDSERLIANRYKIESMLGQGGMGTVYRGTDLQTGQTVAIKSLKAEIIAEEPTMLERFAREGEALRMLNHPNIVKMLATAEQDGQHYLVMEYAGGGSLLDLLRKQEQLPINFVLEAALDLADALTRAHRMKIIHRDIKPANVLLTEDGVPKLTDFGVAQMGSRTRMTQSGALIGTYAYLSPEVLSGDPLDSRADIWAFGIMLYEMVTGVRPFEAEQTAALLTAILTKPVPPISQFRADVPQELERLILRMLEKDRDLRINSVRVVGAHLEAMLTGDSSQLHELEAGAADTAALRDALAESERFGTPTPTAVQSQAPFSTPQPSTPSPAPSPMMGVPVPDGTLAPTSTLAKKVNPLFVVLGIGVALILLAVVGFVLRPSGTTNTAIATVEPVQAGEYMVLVAQIERLGGDERDVQRIITEDLYQVLEVEIPFSNLRARAYPAVIRSNAEAQAAAGANNAAVVVWGHYDVDGVTLEVQMGSTASFPHIAFERTLLERTANIRVQLMNERTQTIAPQVVTLLVSLQNANSDLYQLIRGLAVLDAIDEPRAEIVGNSVAAQTQRTLLNYLSDPTLALAEINAAIQQDTSNPFLYSTRSLLYMSQGAEYFDEAQRDIGTLERLAPDGWLIPLYTQAGLADLTGNWAQALEAFNSIVEQRPDEWFPLNYRAALRYLLSDFEGAQADYERVFTLNPDANFPYLVAAVLAVRQGRITDARGYINTILTRFPDPAFANRVVQVLYGDTPSIFGTSFLAFGSLLLGQFDQTIQYAQAAQQIAPNFGDLYLLEGLAYCNLDQYEESEAAYTRAIEVDPEFSILYGLRAQVRQALGDMMGALNDFSVVSQVDLGEEFETLLAEASSGEIDCKNFFAP
jgi:serine/threonine-protein kinase